MGVERTPIATVPKWAIACDARRLRPVGAAKQRHTHHQCTGPRGDLEQHAIPLLTVACCLAVAQEAKGKVRKHFPLY